MRKTALEIATLINGIIEGNPDVIVSNPSRIEEGSEGCITFLANAKYEHYLYSTQASIVIVEKTFAPKEPLGLTLIKVDNVYNAISVLLADFSPSVSLPEISSLAFIHEDTQLGSGVGVGSFASIQQGVKIGKNSMIHDQVYLGANVEIGEYTILYPGVKILAGCKIGSHCIIHANTVIGSDGFGFVPQENGSYQKIPHVGNVVVEDQVEIGANTTIDRSTMGSTIIRQGVKLDNLVQLGHNIEIGKNTVIASQSGVAGSTKIGESVRIGGQVGFSGHIQVADKTEFQAQSGIAASIKTEGKRFFGSPAIDYNAYIRSYSVFKRLPELYRTIHRLVKEIEKLKEK